MHFLALYSSSCQSWSLQQQLQGLPSHVEQVLNHCPISQNLFKLMTAGLRLYKSPNLRTNIPFQDAFCLHLSSCYFSWTLGLVYIPAFLLPLLLAVHLGNDSSYSPSCSLSWDLKKPFRISFSPCHWINTGQCWSLRCSDHLRNSTALHRTLAVSVSKVHTYHSSVQAKDHQIWEAKEPTLIIPKQIFKLITLNKF